MTYYDTVRLVDAYAKHRFQAIVDAAGLVALFQSAFGPDRIASTEFKFIVNSCQTTFTDADGGVLYTQEVLSTLVLLCDAPWTKRAELLHQCFKCIGTDAMSHEDVILAAQVVAVAMCRLWGTPRWSTKTLTSLAEAIADNAFTKLEKDIDDHVGESDFVAWATDRFRDTRTVGSSDALKGLYHLPV